MNVGIMLPAGGSPGAFAEHAEKMGLESVWTGDHLISVGPKLDSTLLLAQAAATTTRLRARTGWSACPSVGTTTTDRPSYWPKPPITRRAERPAPPLDHPVRL
jgi:hypothetical protein